MPDSHTGAGMILDGEATEPVEIEPERTKDMVVDVMFKAQHVTRLHLKEPTGAQFEKATAEIARGVDHHSMHRFKITLIAAVAKVPREVIEQLSMTEIEDAASFLARLLPGGQVTGVM